MNKKIALSALTLCVTAALQPASANVYAWRGDGSSNADKIYVGENWYSVTDQVDIDSNNTTWYQGVWTSTDKNIMLFDNQSSANTQLINNFNDLSFSGLVVNADSAADEYTIRSNNQTADRNLYFNSTDASDITTVNNKSMVAGATNIIVAAGKKLNIGGGNYAYKNTYLNNAMNIVTGENAQFLIKANNYATNNHDTLISGAGTFVLDVTSVTGTGQFKLQDSTLEIVRLVELANDISISGTSTIKAAGELTLSGNLIFEQAGSSLILEGDNISLNGGLSICVNKDALFGGGITITGLQGEIDDLVINIIDASGNIVSSSANYGSYTNDGNGNYTLTIVPEPTTATLSLLALAGLMARRRRKA